MVTGLAVLWLAPDELHALAGTETGGRADVQMHMANSGVPMSDDYGQRSGSQTRRPHPACGQGWTEDLGGAQ